MRSIRLETMKRKNRRVEQLHRFAMDSLFLVVALGLILGGALVVVWPLWYLATHFLVVYTWLCLLGFCAVVLTLAVNRLKGRRQQLRG